MATAALPYSSQVSLEEGLTLLNDDDDDDRQGDIDIESPTTEPVQKDLLMQLFEWIQKRVVECGTWIKNKTIDAVKKETLKLYSKALGITLNMDGVLLAEELLSIRQTWDMELDTEKITSREVLKPGDHIAVRMKRSCSGPGQSWWNHMIVTSKDRHGTLYVTCPCVPDENPDKVQFEADLIHEMVGTDCALEMPTFVVWETALPWRSVEEAVRYSHRRNPCSPEKVVEKALSKLDEKVDILTVTSEHFATQCAASEVSKNAEIKLQLAKLYSKALGSIFKFLLKLVKRAVKKGLKVLTSKAVISSIPWLVRLLQFAGFGIGILFDLIITGVKIGVKCYEYRVGKLSKKEFRDYMVQAVSVFITNTIFAFISFLISFATLPVPWLGFLINAVLFGLHYLTEKAVRWVVGEAWDAYWTHRI